MLRHLNPEGIAAPGPYSHGVEASSIQRMLFISGQVGIRPDRSLAEDISEQTRVAIQNLTAVLADAGMDTSNIVKITIFLTDESLVGGFMEAGAGLLPAPPPATTLVYVKALAAPPMLVEIEAIAVK
jgi:enamine deaminase RidA (YjgF/YER057c/UK114 family)